MEKSQLHCVSANSFNPDGIKKSTLITNNNDLIKHHQARAPFWMQIMDLSILGH